MTVTDEVMKRRVRAACWLFHHSRAARLVFVAALFPVVWSADRLRGYDPPVSWRRGMQWVRNPDRLPYGGTIPTASTPATVRPDPAPFSPRWRNPCPYDTNGDGDCARATCPRCAPQNQPDRLAVALARIAELAALEPGWQDDARVPTGAALECARRIAAVAAMMAAVRPSGPPQVVPLTDGSVQMEWHEGGWDVEIGIAPNGDFDVWAQHGDSGREITYPEGD